MATWAEFEELEPDMAATGRALLEQHGLAYLATVRADGAPRVHPVSPVIAEGRLFVATHRTSPKRFDLLRDGRYALHMLPGEGDGEFWIRGRARKQTDHTARVLVLESAGRTLMPDGKSLQITEDEWLFEYDLEEAGTAAWEHVGTPAIRVSRRYWRAEALETSW